jgi:hypothetical protein
LLANDPKQRRIVRRFDGHIPSIDIETRHGFFPCRCMKPLTAELISSCWLAPTGPMPMRTE